MFLHIPDDLPLQHPLVVFDADTFTLDHKGLGRLFARLSVRDGDDGAILDRWVGEQVGLEFGGRDLVAFDLDELLDAVHDPDVFGAGGGGDADLDLVARAHPAVGGRVGDEGVGVRFFVLEIAERDAGGLDPELARRVVRRDVLSGGGDDARDHPRVQRSGTAGPEVVTRLRAADGAGFREAVALGEDPVWVHLGE